MPDTRQNSVKPNQYFRWKDQNADKYWLKKVQYQTTEDILCDSTFT